MWQNFCSPSGLLISCFLIIGCASNLSTTPETDNLDSTDRDSQAVPPVVFSVIGSAEDLAGRAPVEMLVTASGDYCVPDDTDGAGSFTVEKVEAGNKRLITYGETAANGLFASIVIPVTVDGNIKIERPVLSPRLTERHPIDPESNQIQWVESDEGLRLEIAPGSIEFAPFMPEEVQVARIPLESTPPFVPDGIELLDLFVLHPIRSTFEPAASVKFPVLPGTEPGTAVHFYALDYNTGWLKKVAEGVVDENGRPSSADGQGITELTWIGIALAP